jgi:hypothetical protein
VVSSLQEIDGFVTDAIDQPVFLRDAARPAPGQYIPQRLRLSWAFERVAHYGLNQIEDADRHAPLTIHPGP